jgi:glutathione S-transferase
MKLYYSDASPYARKVRIVAAEKNIPLDVIPVVASDDPPELHKANPIGKVPTLVVDDRISLGESGHICAYLESLVATPRVFSNDVGTMRRDAEAIGLMDALIRIVLEIRRPEDKQLQTWIDRQYRAINRTLDELEDETFGTDFTIDQITLAAALGYFDLRFPDYGWRTNHQKLTAWFEKISERPSVKQTKPA